MAFEFLVAFLHPLIVGLDALSDRWEVVFTGRGDDRVLVFPGVVYQLFASAAENNKLKAIEATWGLEEKFSCQRSLELPMS